MKNGLKPWTTLPNPLTPESPRPNILPWLSRHTTVTNPSIGIGSISRIGGSGAGPILSLHGLRTPCQLRLSSTGRNNGDCGWCNGVSLPNQAQTNFPKRSAMNSTVNSPYASTSFWTQDTEPVFSLKGKSHPSSRSRCSPGMKMPINWMLGSSCRIISTRW